MLLALTLSLSAQAAPPATTDFTVPTVPARYSLVDSELRLGGGSALPVMGQEVYGYDPGWWLIGLGLLGTGAFTMGVAVVGMSATDIEAVDAVFGVLGLVGAVHFVVGAGMLGIEFVEFGHQVVGERGHGVGRG